MSHTSLRTFREFLTTKFSCWLLVLSFISGTGATVLWPFATRSLDANSILILVSQLSIFLVFLAGILWIGDLEKEEIHTGNVYHVRTIDTLSSLNFSVNLIYGFISLNVVIFGNLGHDLSAYKMTISMLTLILITLIVLSWAPTLRLVKMRGPHSNELVEDIESLGSKHDAESSER